MYDPSIQRAILECMAKWGRLPEEDLLTLLSPLDRLRFRPDALADLAGEGLVSITRVGDEPVIALTRAGEAWLGGTGNGLP
jgi:hypothetical protein